MGFNTRYVLQHQLFWLWFNVSEFMIESIAYTTLMGWSKKCDWNYIEAATAIRMVEVLSKNPLDMI